MLGVVIAHMFQQLFFVHQLRHLALLVQARGDIPGTAMVRGPD
jgi:hypothetical protein